MSSILETIPPGKTMKEAIEGLFASRYLPPQSRLEIWGAVRSAIVVAAPGATPFHLDTPAFIVSAHAHRKADVIEVYGCLSWVDNGLPRMMAGLLQDADSDGLSVLLPPDSVTAHPSPAPIPVSAAPSRKAPPVIAEPEPKEEPAPPPVADASWGTAVSASAAVEAPAPAVARAPKKSGQLDAEGLPQFKRGDIVVHPRYGRCAVVRSPKFHKLKLRRTTGAFFDLHLKVCSFEVEEDDDGHAVYRVQIVGRNETN